MSPVTEMLKIQMAVVKKAHRNEGSYRVSSKNKEYEQPGFGVSGQSEFERESRSFVSGNRLLFG